MSKFSESLRSVGIANDYDFAGKGNLVISYFPATTGRGCLPAKWVVYRPGFKIYPDAPWYDYGNKCFASYSRNTKAATLVKAQAWAGERYGIKEWAKTPFGAWMDAEFVKRRVTELQQQLKESKP